MNKVTYCLVVLACSLPILACSLVQPATPAALPAATVAAIPAATPTPIPAVVPPTQAPTPTPAATLAPTPLPSAQPPLGTPTPFPPPAGQPQELKACSLLTAAEAEAILGQPAALPQEINGACAIANAKDGLYMVSVTAAQGQQAEGILQGQAFLLGMAGVPLDETKMARLKELSDAGDFAGFFAEMVALAQGAPAVQARLVDGMGDAGAIGPG